MVIDTMKAMDMLTVTVMVPTSEKEVLVRALMITTRSGYTTNTTYFVHVLVDFAEVFRTHLQVACLSLLLLDCCPKVKRMSTRKERA